MAGTGATLAEGAGSARPDRLGAARKPGGCALAGAAGSARGFTLMELMVAITILIFIILSVGQIFKSASNSVSVSQATMELLSNVRAVQQMMDRDVQGIDRSAFLVIRSRLETLPSATTPDPRHFDQIAFVSLGSFPNRTGANDPAAPFAESTVANASFVHWAQLVLERNSPPDTSYNTVAGGPVNQAAKVPLNRLPTGAIDNGAGSITVKESEFALGRNGFLLLPGAANFNVKTIVQGGRPLAAYPSINWNYDALGAGFATAGESVAADITSSRVAVAGVSPAQLLEEMAQRRLADPQVEANQYCYRFKALASVYDTDVPDNPFVNGYFRMHPVALQGVSSFKVEWTNGSVFPPGGGPHGEQAGQLMWFGPSTLQTGVPQAVPLFSGAGYLPDNNVEGYFSTPNANGDHYLAIFNYLNKSKWPKALRITYHVAELNNRLQGGRDFTQVIKLPD